MDRDNELHALLHGDDSEYWDEQVQIDRWMDAGCPDVDEWLGKAKPKPQDPHEVLPISERLTLSKREAGMLLGKSEDWIEKYVLPNVKTVQQSRSVMIPTADLQRWVHENSRKAL
jgi:hypothetical protein